MSRTLIRNASVVFPDETVVANVLVEGERIADIDAAASVRADEVVDATGLHLLPGVIDDQVHFRDPGFPHKEDLRTASRACAKGGVTSFLEMPNTRPTTITQERLDAKLALAATKSLVNYGFYIGATPDNLADLQTARRTPGIKIFMGASTGELLVEQAEALERIFAGTTLPICTHCEDEALMRANRERIGETHDIRDHSRIRDHAVALKATQQAIDLALRHQHRLHILHVSTADEARLIGETGGPYVTAEVCPHHLFFNVDDYDRLGARIQMNPSIKTAADNAALWEALVDNRIPVIATDHAPHTLEEKAQPYPASPSGIPAVENLLPLILNQAVEGRCTLQQVVGWLCEAPARVWDIVNKGRIAAGYDADLVLVDLALTKEIRDAEQETKVRWSPWHGTTIRGWPVRTWVMGKTVYDNGHLHDAPAGREIQYDHARGGYWAT